jgi:hypothetical protein
MKLFDCMDKGTLKQCLENARSLDYQGIMNILEDALNNITALSQTQWIALATVGLYLMNEHDRDRVLKNRRRDLEMER